MILIKYILNNILRKKKQTFFFVLAVLLPSFIILADFSMIGGIKNELNKNINEAISGQLLILSIENNKIDILESQIDEMNLLNINEYDIKQIESISDAITINRRIRLGSLVSFGEETSYTNAHALEGDHLRRLAGMLTMRKGKMAEKENEITISKSLAKDLLCDIGDTLLLLANNIDGYMTDAVGVVSGVFEEKGIAIFLNYNAFMPYSFGCDIAGIPEGEAVELVINHADGQDFSRQEIASLTAYFRQVDPAAKMAGWEQTVPLMRAIVQVWRGGGVFTQVVFISFSLIILVTLSSLVIRSRRKETGTLLAIGFSWGKIKAMLCSEYLLLTLLSLMASGLLLAAVLSMTPPQGLEIGSEYMQAALMTDKLRPAITFSDFCYVLVLFVLTAAASTLISIRKLEREKVHSLINN